MTEWTGSSPGQLEISLMSFDEFVAAVDGRAATDAVVASPIDGGFSLAASISAGEQMQWFADVYPGASASPAAAISAAGTSGTRRRQLPDRRSAGRNR